MIAHIKKKTRPLLFGLVFLMLAVAIQLINYAPIKHLLTNINGIVYDTMTKYHLNKRPNNTNVVIIDIDNQSIQQQGRWPWPRDKMSVLLNNLQQAGVVVVAFDIVMSQEEANAALMLKENLSRASLPNQDVVHQIIPLLEGVAPYVDHNQIFANELKKNDVVLGYLFQENPSIRIGSIPKPLNNEQSQPINTAQLSTVRFQGFNGTVNPLFDASPKGGFVSSFPDDDGIQRHGLLVASFDDHLYASLALSTVMHYLMADTIQLLTYTEGGKQVFKGINVGGMFVPTNKNGQVLIPYYGPPGTMDYYSASDVIDGKIPKNGLAGAIAIVGSTMVLLSDLHASPLSEAFPGIEMNANIITGILSQQLLSQFDWGTWHGLAVLLIIGGGLAILFAFLEPMTLVLVYSFLIVILLTVTFFLFVYQKLYIDIAVLFFLITSQAIIDFIYSFQLERRQKNKIKELFGQYVPPSYVKQLTEFPELYSSEGETRNMSVFFADIRNFTTISESLDASGVKSLLNTIFTPMTDIIFSHQGTIDKYVGDMVVAFWGAPMEDSEHATHAIEAALDIQNKLEKINQELLKKNLPCVKIGMGLSSGLMNVGDMGSDFRRAYTVLGDTVNLGSRLQDLTKYYHVNILASEATYLNQATFVWQHIDKVAVKGRHEPLNIYEPLGYIQDALPDLLVEIEEYNKALVFYYQQQWAIAQEMFETLVQRYPSRYLYQMYSMRIAELINKPMLPDWDGAFIHTHK